MYFQCIFNVLSMYLSVFQCIYNVFSMYLQCIFNVLSMYLTVFFNVFTMYFQCNINLISIALSENESIALTTLAASIAEQDSVLEIILGQYIIVQENRKKAKEHLKTFMNI